MARPRYTTRFTLRLDPTLRDSLQSEASAKGDDFADHVREILTDHTARRSTERPRLESRR
jgi:predicted HicB family RNase H-like nuclease